MNTRLRVQEKAISTDPEQLGDVSTVYFMRTRTCSKNARGSFVVKHKGRVRENRPCTRAHYDAASRKSRLLYFVTEHDY